MADLCFIKIRNVEQEFESDLRDLLKPFGEVDRIYWGNGHVFMLSSSIGCTKKLWVHISLCMTKELQVRYNNDQSWDFTNPSLPTACPSSSQMERAAVIAVAFGGSLPPGVTGTNEWCTLMKIDEDKLFNLFSLYGNIVRIRICQNKPDCALVEMADGLQTELAVHYLKGAPPLFGKNMKLNYSKEYPKLAPGLGTKEYSKSNRFTNHYVKSYRYCCAPTKALLWAALVADPGAPPEPVSPERQTAQRRKDPQMTLTLYPVLLLWRTFPKDRGPEGVDNADT
ncbi:hypothetical protein PR202_ga05248 [Eleusine coracana subsp. coracana]|uniref:RRM domain-containing protein n=1 Tax=Eleusine coracana subsp. coracana TaxID=191504 RepID=A0AAV5BRX4_ELECO|nr:hypothetical protein PR202_ga04793 [Eleusine coracana subsp. coracana]GJM89100.1 hypothetical protein PR202_ga05248 [Eleusine coracana subsp. coracana]